MRSLPVSLTLPVAVTVVMWFLVQEGYESCLYTTQGAWIGTSAGLLLLFPLNLLVFGGIVVWIAYRSFLRRERAPLRGPLPTVVRATALGALVVAFAGAAISVEGSMLYHLASPEALHRCGGGTPPWWPGW